MDVLIDLSCVSSSWSGIVYYLCIYAEECSSRLASSISSSKIGKSCQLANKIQNICSARRFNSNWNCNSNSEIGFNFLNSRMINNVYINIICVVKRLNLQYTSSRSIAKR